ncbi:uncharacterized protein METZ01_LOCUS168895 [marine metagenome]|uniref:Uncharacterized protein n=1 Tax=marine metagenome TaxID=408172 RepID=A0A382BR82_9ZZZZ
MPASSTAGAGGGKPPPAPIRSVD